ncbi:hypothetical protein FRB90_011837 [Tulasnella sp. 427]|nr:hypothetical protein FRB90_011837 [Tulasnella sp. 427]
MDLSPTSPMSPGQNSSINPRQHSRQERAASDVEHLKDTVRYLRTILDLERDHQDLVRDQKRYADERRMEMAGYMDMPRKALSTQLKEGYPILLQKLRNMFNLAAVGDPAQETAVTNLTRDIEEQKAVSVALRQDIDSLKEQSTRLQEMVTESRARVEKLAEDNSVVQNAMGALIRKLNDLEEKVERNNE